MNQFGLIVSTCMMAFFPISLSGQTVCVGNGGKPCTPKESRQAQEQICKTENAPSNLSIESTLKLTGVLLDPTGTPIVFKNAMVQIRDVKTGKVLLSSLLDTRGHFDLGLVPAGKFRFLALMLKDGKPARLPLADQPKALSCSTGTECGLEITIHFHGTDNPVDFCPPK